MPPNLLILCRPLLLLPSIFPSIRVFSNESALCIRWPTCWSWSFSFSISPSSEHSGWVFCHYLRVSLTGGWPLTSLQKSWSVHHRTDRCRVFTTLGWPRLSSNRPEGLNQSRRGQKLLGNVIFVSWLFVHIWFARLHVFKTTIPPKDEIPHSIRCANLPFLSITHLKKFFLISIF